MNHRTWICCQLGAREHYAVPRALQQMGQLGVLYTDFWAGAGLRRSAKLIGSALFHSLAGRFHDSLANASVISWNLKSLGWELYLRRQSRLKGSDYWGYLQVGRRFGSAVREALLEQKDLSSENFFLLTTPERWRLWKCFSRVEFIVL
jgi:hypothetical protein